MKIKTDNIFQVVEFEAPVQEVYEALTKEQLHARFTGMPAQIENHVGGMFRTCGQFNFGYNLFLDENKRIVQAWSHKDFTQGFYSTVVMDFEKTENGTRINFNHLGVPEEHCGWLTEGWRKTYWEPLKNFLEVKLVKEVH